MKNKKGFTLIELLAVIVILAVISVIAVPQILDVVQNSRRSAAKVSALGYIEAIDSMELNDFFNENKTTLSEGEHSVGDITNINMKGAKPLAGTVSTDSYGKVSTATLCMNDFKVTYDGTNAAVVANNCDDMEYVDPIESATGESSVVSSIRYDKETDFIQILGEEGIWHDWTKVGLTNYYLYHNGDTFIDKTIGWDKNNAYAALYPTYESRAMKLDFNDGYKSVNIEPNNKSIDFSAGYDRIEMDYSAQLRNLWENLYGGVLYIKRPNGEVVAQTFLRYSGSHTVTLTIPTGFTEGYITINAQSISADSYIEITRIEIK